jgi:hypothetical protein
VVRGPAAVLGALAGALTYFLAAPLLPEIHDEKISLFVAGAVGVAWVVLCVMTVIPAADSPFAFALVVPGAALIVGALSAADVGAGASPIEAVLFGSIGAVFAVALETASLALALPVFVAVIDAASVFGGGPSSKLASGETKPGDPLTLQFPDIGNGLSAGRMGIADVVFFAVFTVFARHLDLRRRATPIAMFAGLLGTFAAHVWWDRALPAIPAMAAAYFLVNLDRLPALFRRASEG